MSEQLPPNVVVCEADATQLLYLFTMYLGAANDTPEHEHDDIWVRQRQLAGCLALASTIQGKHIPAETDDLVPVRYLRLHWQEVEFIKQAHQLAKGITPKLSPIEDWPSPKPAAS